MVAKQRGQHFAHDAGDIVAVAVHRCLVCESVERFLTLVIDHAVGHRAYARFHRRALVRVETVRDADHGRGLGDELALRREGVRGEPRREFGGKRRGVAIAANDINERLRVT